MAYVEIPITGTDSKSIVDVALMGQMNENTIDHETRILGLETSTGLQKLMYRQEFDFTSPVASSFNTAFVAIPLTTSITNQVMTPSTAPLFTPITAGDLDFSSFRFGDGAQVKIFFTKISGVDQNITFKLSGPSLFSEEEVISFNGIVTFNLSFIEEVSLTTLELSVKSDTAGHNIEINSISIFANLG